MLLIRLFTALFALLLPSLAPAQESLVDGVLTGEGYSSLPLRLAGDDHLEIASPVLINGQRARLIVDTGAQISVIDPRAVKRLKLSLEKTASKLVSVLGGRGGRLRAGVAESFRLGPLEMRPFIFGVTLLDALNASGDKEVRFDGLVGAEVLRTYQFVIDYRGMQLFVRQDAPENAAKSQLGARLKRAGYAEIPLAKTSYSEFELRTKINDTTFHLLLDTGAALTLIDSSMAGFAEIPVEKTDLIVGGATGAGVRLGRGRVRTFRAGSFKVEGVSVGVVDLSHSNRQLQNAGQASIAGYLGSDFLRRYEAVIDCANLKLYLRARE
ncbi:MAG: retropepsin-like domain-containing protein [Verrucomicrobia bacterium]|nr:retropepsin-like domain-containing protein [Verrucomicrobiota bacterium]